MAFVVITFLTSSTNVQVKYAINGVDQGVDATNSPIIINNAAPGAYAVEQTITTKDKGANGGDWCHSVVREQGQAQPIGEIPASLNTISAGQNTDTAYSSFTVV